HVLAACPASPFAPARFAFAAALRLAAPLRPRCPASLSCAAPLRLSLRLRCAHRSEVLAPPLPPLIVAGAPPSTPRCRSKRPARTSLSGGLFFGGGPAA